VIWLKLYCLNPNLQVTGQVHLAEYHYAWSGWRAEVTGNARVSVRSA
jgi:hypothetical protein